MSAQNEQEIRIVNLPKDKTSEIEIECERDGETVFYTATASPEGILIHDLRKPEIEKFKELGVDLTVPNQIESFVINNDIILEARIDGKDYDFYPEETYKFVDNAEELIKESFQRTIEEQRKGNYDPDFYVPDPESPMVLTISNEGIHIFNALMNDDCKINSLELGLDTNAVMPIEAITIEGKSIRMIKVGGVEYEFDPDRDYAKEFMDKFDKCLDNFVKEHPHVAQK